MLPGSRPGEIPGLRTGSDSSAVGPASRRPRCGLLAAEALEPRQLLSATYFVSPTGSDANAGTIGRRSAPSSTPPALPAPATSWTSAAASTARPSARPAPASPAPPSPSRPTTARTSSSTAPTPSPAGRDYSGSIYQANDPGDLGFGNNQVFVNGQAMSRGHLAQHRPEPLPPDARHRPERRLRR